MFSSTVTYSSRPAAAATIKQERQQAAQIYRAIQTQQRRIGFLEGKYLQAQLKLNSLHSEIANTQQIVAAAGRKVSVDQVKLRAAALNAFVNNGSAAAGNPLFSTNESNVESANVYRNIAEGNLSTSVANLRNSSLFLTQQRKILRSELSAQTSATRTANSALRWNQRLNAQLIREQHSVNGAISSQIAHLEALARHRTYLKWLQTYKKHHRGRGPGSTTHQGSGYNWLIPNLNKNYYRAVSTALSYVGVPYLWAGASRNGVDCSGLIMLAWNSAGVYLPHYSGAQYNDSVRIPIYAMRPGDLLFYGWHGDEHETMYVGHGLMVEAPYTGTRVHVTPVRFDFGFAGVGRVR